MIFSRTRCLTCAAKDAEIQRLTHLLHTERQLSDAMTRQMMTDVLLLKRDGFVARAVPSPLAPVPAETIDPLEATIREYEEKAPKSANVRQGLQLYVARMQAQGKSEQEIIVGIHKGGGAMDDDDDA